MLPKYGKCSLDEIGVGNCLLLIQRRVYLLCCILKAVVRSSVAPRTGLQSMLPEGKSLMKQSRTQRLIGSVCLCTTCLGLGRDTPAPYEIDGLMYCAEHRIEH